MKRFEVYCPAGWTHVDLARDPAQQARAVASAVVPAGDGAAQLRGQVARHLEGAFAGLAERGAWSVMLPVAGPTAVAVRPLVVFAPLSLPADTEPMDGLVALAASDPSAEVVDIDPLVALRTARTDDVTESLETSAAEIAPGLAGMVEGGARPDTREDAVVVTQDAPRAVARRVRYLLGDVEDADRWAEVSFSLTHLDDPDQRDLADAAVGAFDALVRTFRWQA